MTREMTRTKQQSIAKSAQAVIFAAGQLAVMERMLHHGNPAIRRAAETMYQIVSMHRLGDYNLAREHQIANDALFYLPMAEIERLCAAYVRTL